MSELQIKEYPDDPGYLIYSDGRVYSKKSNKFLKPQHHVNGYYQYGFSTDGHHKTKLVHRLVAETFIPNPDNLPEVNHKDEDKSNNNIDNLEWCSREYNNSYGTRNERTSKTLEKKVLMLDKDTEEILKEFNSVKEAAEAVGLKGNATIIEVCRGRRKTSAGYKWRYAED